MANPVRTIQTTSTSNARLIASRFRALPFMPANWLPSLKAARVLWRDLAHVKTVRSRTAVDASGNPLPWYTYPAIHFLSQLDFSHSSVFEYGSGMSTLFWAARAKEVVAVEDDEHWYAQISSRVPSNVDLALVTDIAEYPHAIHRRAEDYDIIIVDGPARGRTRLKCCRQALKRLRPGGLIVLDNSDWLPESSKLLREAGLLEVDMTGFAPVSTHVQTTSFYFHRQFARPPLTGRQPLPAAGSRLEVWEKPLTPAAGALIWCDDEPFRGVQHDTRFTVDIDGTPRSFRALCYIGGNETRHIAILDLDRERVLLTLHKPRRARTDCDFAVELGRIATMPPAAFVAFINSHEHRRYLLGGASPTAETTCGAPPPRSS